MTIELTVPCVAAHLLVTPVNLPEHNRHLAHGKSFRHGCHTCVPDGPRPMVLRFLPTDADTECERCGGIGWVAPSGRLLSKRRRCPDCTNGRRPLRAGDRIAIRADDDVPPCDCDQWDGATQSVVPFRAPHACSQVDTTELRPGDIAGYATVTNVLPIVDACRVAPPYPDDGLYVCTCGEHEGLWLDSDWPTDLSDHVDAGLVFTQGGVALELAAEDGR